VKPCRFYQRPINRGVVSLAGSEARHIATVLRLGVGDEVELFDGAGTIAQARIERVANRCVEIRVEEARVVSPRTSGRIIIAASLAKGERFDGLIGKCTKLGVDHICPVIFERTVKKSEGKHVLARFEKLAVSAAKQSGRLFLPLIEAPVRLAEMVAKLQAAYPDASWLLGDWSDQAGSLAGREWDRRDVIAFIGPEGGMTESEKNLLMNSSARPVCLAQTVLRVETAAVSFAAILGAQRLAKEMEVPC